MTAPYRPAEFAADTGVSRETLARFEAYAALLTQWSPRINLVSKATLSDLWRRHFLDAAQLKPYVPPGARSLLDIGSGAGFPGLVLAILGVPGVELVEADARKCTFLREAARVTDTAMTIRNARIESVPAHIVDVVTARACAPLPRLLEWAEAFTGPETKLLLLKGERVEDELTAAREDWTMSAACHPSRSDPSGVILSLDRVIREPVRT